MHLPTTRWEPKTPSLCLSQYYPAWYWCLSTYLCSQSTPHFYLCGAGFLLELGFSETTDSYLIYALWLFHATHIVYALTLNFLLTMGHGSIDAAFPKCLLCSIRMQTSKWLIMLVSLLLLSFQKFASFLSLLLATLFSTSLFREMEILWALEAVGISIPLLSQML